MEVPVQLVTVILTVLQAIPAGAEVTVIWVAESMVKPVVRTVVPKATDVVPIKFVPVMVTVFPPADDPDEGLTPVTVGSPKYMY